MTDNSQTPEQLATERLVLVDGSSFLFRAYHAMPDLATRSGQLTGAVYGVTNMLRRLIKECPLEYVAIVYDAKGKTFRHAMYDLYKANRPATPPDLVAQIKYVHQITQAMGLPLLCVPGVEADDVIGTLAQQAAADGMDCLIVTGDKDMAQLVNARITLIDTMKGQTLDAQGVFDKFGVWPGQMIDYLALVGDSADNIPGVPKVGPKTAAKWLAEYSSIDEIMASADKITGKVGENLRAHLTQLALSRKLATIKLDVALEHRPADLLFQAPDRPALAALYKELEFNNWARELPAAETATTAAATGAVTGAATAVGEAAAAIDISQYQTILAVDVLDEWLEKLAAAGIFALDTETTGLDPQQAGLVGLSFCATAGEAAYLPLKHSYTGVPQQIDFALALRKLKPLLENPAIKKIGQNIKYDCIVLAHHGIALAGIEYDTMLESYVTEAGITNQNMDTLAQRHLDHTPIAFKQVAGSGKKQLTFDQVDLAVATPYAAEDADITLRLHQVLWPKVQENAPIMRLFRSIEMPLLPVLARTEMHGVKLDAALLAAQSGQLGSALKQLEAQCYEAAGMPFNIASPKQIQAILYEQLKLPVLKKTPGGQPSTAEYVLQGLADDGHALPRLILEHRSLAKLKSTYTDKLPRLINPRTGRVHTSYHQAVAATGRLSSSDPNLQNIPIRSAAGRKIRGAFIAEAGHKLLAADYSQIELRLMAHLSEDARLIDAFQNGIDVHSATAAEVFGVALEAVDHEQRRRAKAINFGLIYGMSAFGLSKQLGIERQQAQDYITLYFARYPGVKRYMEAMRVLAAEQGYVETLHGRRLYLPEIRSSNFNRRQYAERTAINAPMQGSAADLIKLAMIEVDRWVRENQIGTKIILQVHDELVLEVPEQNLAEMQAMIAPLMTQVASLKVPLLVDTGVGDNWKEAH